MKKKHLLSILFPILVSTSVFSQISFKESDKLTSRSWFYAVQTADMNNDGLDDVIGATSYMWDETDEDAKIYIYYQDTLGKLHKEVTIGYPKQYPGLSSMAIGDMDNNHLKDIIIAFSDSIGISYQTSKNVFSRFKTWYCSRMVDQVQCMDLNNDSLPDILVKNFDYNSVLTVFYQTETGLVRHALSNPKPYAYILLDAGDVNKDGYPDIVHHYTYYNPDTNVFIMKNAPVNGFEREDTSLTYSVNGEDKVLADLVFGDYNTDGKPDVLGLDAFNGSVYLWQNSGSGFNPMTRIKTDEYASRVGARDFNCDSINEIFSVGSTRISTHEAADSFKTFRTSEVQNQSSSLSIRYNRYSIGDLNHDGKPDFALSYADGIVIMENTTIPERFSSIDTIIRVDTVIASQDTFTYKTFRLTALDTVDNAVIVQLDSFYTVETYKIEDIKTDSIFIRKGDLCHKSYTDTLQSSAWHYYNNIDSWNTTVFYSSLDTIFITNTADLSRISDVKLFPNPATDCLHIALPSPVDYGNTVLEIVSLDGSVLYKRSGSETGEPLISVNLHDFKSGVYLVKISTGQKTFTGRFIKN